MRDVRYAIRVLLRAPAFTITAVLTLALCIGANTAIFTVVDRVLLRALPYPHPDQLAMIGRHYQGADRAEDDLSQSGHTWLALRQSKAPIDVAVFSLGGSVNLVVRDRAMPVTQQRVSAGYFRVLGVAPERGREFTDDEDRAGGAAVAGANRPVGKPPFPSHPANAAAHATSLGDPPLFARAVAPLFLFAPPQHALSPQ